MSTLKVTSLQHESASSANITLDSSGNTTINGTLSGADMGLSSVQVFTSSGTWTKPSGVSKVVVEVQGAGGSGSATTYWSNGVGGGYAKKLLDVSSISSSTITVGSGGAAVSANGGAGNAGGSSSWADGTNTITGNGGSGGSATDSYTNGVTGTGGDINLTSQPTAYVQTWGGASPLGFGGGSKSYGRTGVGYGGGGGNGSTSAASGAGADGIVIVWEYK